MEEDEKEKRNVYKTMRKKNRVLEKGKRRGWGWDLKWKETEPCNLWSSFISVNGLVIFLKEGRKKDSSAAWIPDDTGQKKGKCS